MARTYGFSLLGKSGENRGEECVCDATSRTCSMGVSARTISRTAAVFRAVIDPRSRLTIARWVDPYERTSALA